MTSATTVETKHVKVGSVSYAYRELADAQVAVYPLAGHAPHQQHPAEVAVEVERFLSRT